MNDKIAFALDVSSRKEALYFADVLGSHISTVKVGLELFATDQSIISTLQKNFRVILDLKLHDIPETVARTVKVLGDQGIQYLTIHIQQARTLELASRAAQEFGMLLIGVSVLTSIDEWDCEDLGLLGPPAQRANELVKFAHEHGVRGFVCSPQEVKELRNNFPNSYFLVPGVRMHTAKDEHKRTGTPGQAIKDGASVIVVGRPIKDAANPIVAIKEIIADIEKENV